MKQTTLIWYPASELLPLGNMLISTRLGRNIKWWQRWDTGQKSIFQDNGEQESDVTCIWTFKMCQ